MCNFDTYDKEDLPLWVFESIAKDSTNIDNYNFDQKYAFIAKLYFYTQQKTKDIAFCYKQAKIKQTKQTDKQILKHIQQLKQFHKDLQQL